ncbi:hypothetical protein FQN52_008927 [Onygenales sp. PD_12]|nr:hypothetical protein FQN52_008927 [Onygenales sp. PD_12]
MSTGLPSPRLPSSLPRPKSVSSKPQPQDQTTAPKPEKTEPNAEQTIENTPANVDDELAEEFRELAISLRECDWEELQKRFTDAMNERSQAENALQKETAELLEMFIAWSQTTIVRDENRAYKRLKTRMGYTQNAEAKLEEKKKHYANVVKAFESALALLHNS